MLNPLLHDCIMEIELSRVFISESVHTNLAVGFNSSRFPAHKDSQGEFGQHPLFNCDG